MRGGYGMIGRTSGDSSESKQVCSDVSGDFFHAISHQPSALPKSGSVRRK